MSQSRAQLIQYLTVSASAPHVTAAPSGLRRSGPEDVLYEARYYGQTSSARLYTGSGKKPRFTKKPTVDEQLNEKPSPEKPESSGDQQTNG